MAFFVYQKNWLERGIPCQLFKHYSILTKGFLLELFKHFSYTVTILGYSFCSLPCMCGCYTHAEYFSIGKVLVKVVSKPASKQDAWSVHSSTHLVDRRREVTNPRQAWRAKEKTSVFPASFSFVRRAPMPILPHRCLMLSLPGFFGRFLWLL